MSFLKKMFGGKKRNDTVRKEAGSALGKLSPSERKKVLVDNVIQLINSARLMNGTKPLGDDETPIWKEVLMNAPGEVLSMPVDGVHTHLDVEEYVKDEIRKDPDRYG